MKLAIYFAGDEQPLYFDDKELVGCDTERIYKLYCENATELLEIETDTHKFMLNKSSVSHMVLKK